MRSNISIAILAAIAGGGMLPMTDINVPGKSLFRREHNRSRASTRLPQRYVHKSVQVQHRFTAVYTGFGNPAKPDRFGLVTETHTEHNVPMRRAERKGINTVPRAPVSSLHAISFG